MKKYFTILLILAMPGLNAAFGQTSAGKCWYIDYEQWNINTPALHILCGNDESFNVGDELTMEMWIRAYTFGENRKVMGKIDSDGSTFSNGYVMGFQNLNVYTEIWNPAIQVIPYSGPGPIPQDSAFVHLVSTYSSASGKLRDYVNGEMVGEVQVFPPSPIAANDAPFEIGAAPWDLFSFQFYGALDEVRVWNTERSQAQIREFMFKELRGDEDGLVAYYNFNTAYDSVVPDLGPHGNHGVLQNSNDDCWSWADSYVPVGDAPIYEMHEPVAAWCGKSPEEFNYALTDNGLSMITDIGAGEFDKYLVFAHNGAAGTTTENIPSGAPADFRRLAREWYVNKGGNVAADIFANLAQAAGGGEALPAGEENNLYVLLYRESPEEDYSALAYADQVFNENLIINDRLVKNGYYSIGYSSTPMSLGTRDQIFENLIVSPNPASRQIRIENIPGAQIRISDILGNSRITTTTGQPVQTIDVSTLEPGIYFISIKKGIYETTQKLIIN